MPNYVKNVLERYRHIVPKQKQDCPYQPAPRQYDHQSEILPKEDPGTLLDDEEEQYIRQVVGSLLYYFRAVDLMILFALSVIVQE